MLIAGIAVSGMGGALLMPSSMAILTNVFTGPGRGTAVGMWGAATELISGVGVVVGGMLTDKLDWRWIFVVNIVVVRCWRCGGALSPAIRRCRARSTSPEFFSLRAPSRRSPSR